jgi:hypothetical protein
MWNYSELANVFRDEVVEDIEVSLLYRWLVPSAIFDQTVQSLTWVEIFIPKNVLIHFFWIKTLPNFQCAIHVMMMFGRHTSMK